MKATLVVKSRFQFFHLARQLEKKGLLEKLYTGYPKFKIKDEKGIPEDKIKTYPWFIVPYMKRGLLGLDKFNQLNKDWQWLTSQTLDKHVAGKIDKKGILISMSSIGLYAGKKMQSLGGSFICQRGSTHIVYQDEILEEEYKRWGFEWKGVDKRIIEKELLEYECADRVTVPSEFARQSFIEKGVSESKIVKISYGARLDRFKKIGEPAKNKFVVLWVGALSLRKGFMYALEAFEKLQYPNKEFIVIGSVSEEIKKLLASKRIDSSVHFKGTVPNTELINYYNSADVFILPSIEDGFGIVLSEALASGCPIIATPNTGSVDLIKNGQEGFIVPIRNADAIVESFQKFIDTPGMRNEMSELALKRVQSIGGWDDFGDNFEILLKSLV